MDKYQLLLSQGGLSLERLHNFCRIAEAGGLSKAAGGDAGKLSLYSRQIRELEEFFGVELKRRQGKGIVITEAGRRLAQLTRAHLLGLEDFQREVRLLPKRLSIAAGNSVLEWTLFPRLAELRKVLPGVLLEFRSLQSGDTVARLIDMTLDIGLVRENAVPAALKRKRLFPAEYALFLPNALAKGITQTNLRERIADLPVAASLGGHFRETLEAAAAKAKWPLKIGISCSSFTQAARAVQSGASGAILPRIAASDFHSSKVVQLPLLFLRAKFPHICVAWNPRLAEVRKIVEEAAGYLVELLAAPNGG
jgi:DNA-binding transcriptional LysR family regulator